MRNKKGNREESREAKKGAREPQREQRRIIKYSTEWREYKLLIKSALFIF